MMTLMFCLFSLFFFSRLFVRRSNRKAHRRWQAFNSQGKLLWFYPARNAHDHAKQDYWKDRTFPIYSLIWHIQDDSTTLVQQFCKQGIDIEEHFGHFLLVSVPLAEIDPHRLCCGSVWPISAFEFHKIAVMLIFFFLHAIACLCHQLVYQTWTLFLNMYNFILPKMTPRIFL